MVRKVVIPATISVLTLVLFSLSLKIRSSICVLPRLWRRVCRHCPVQNQPPSFLPLPSKGRCRRLTSTEGPEVSPHDACPLRRPISPPPPHLPRTPRTTLQLPIPSPLPHH